MTGHVRNQLFISYSHQDQFWLDRFRSWLKPYLNDGMITAWCDDAIGSGQKWETEIESAIDRTLVAVLLVTPDFLASEFIMQNELPLLIKASEDGLLEIAWIAVRPSAFKKTALSKYQGVNDPAEPLAVFDSAVQDQELLDICEKIDKMLEKQAGREEARTANSGQTTPDSSEPASTQCVFGPRLPCPEPFRNRETEMTSLVQDLDEPGVRFACVVGPVGVGKTALVSKFCERVESGAVRLSATARGIGADGIVYFTFRSNEQQASDRLFHDIQRLLPTSEAEDVKNYWKDHNRDERDKFGYLLSKLPGERCLLALDNFEEVLGSDNKVVDPSLSAFLEVCLTTRHALKIIVTSREAVSVGVGAHRAIRTVPLNEGLPHGEAVEMLRDLFQSLDPTGSLGMLDTPDEQLAEAVDRCSGLPSALQLIADILNESLITLSELLDNHELFNEQVVKNLARKQLKFQAENRRLVLQALSVFEIPVPAAAVEFLLASFCSQQDLENVSRCLSTMARSFLVSFSRESKTFGFLEPVKRECAYESIPESGSDYTRRNCHALAARYYLGQRKSAETWQTLDDLHPQLDEIEHRFRAGEYKEATRIVDEIDEKYLLPWGHYGRVVALRERLKDVIQDTTDGARNLSRLGHVYRLTGRRKESIDVGAEAVEVARAANDGEHLIAYVGHLADAYADDGRFPDAVACYEEAVKLARGVGDPKSEAWNLGGLAILYRQSGRIDEAIGCYNRGLEVAREHKDDTLRCRFIGNRAVSHIAQGDVEASLRDSDESLRLSLNLGIRQDESFTYHHIARAYVQMADFEKVKECNRQALEICETITHERRCESIVRWSLGYAHHHLGELDDAELQYKKSFGYHEAGMDYYCAAKLGILQLKRGNQEAAQQQFLTAIELSNRILQSKQDYYEALYQLALAHLGVGHAEEAVAGYHRALEISAHCGTLMEAWLDLELLEEAAPETRGLTEVKAILRDAATKRSCDRLLNRSG